MSLPAIHIIGAGLAGLTLARCLRSRGVGNVVIFEKNLKPARHGYGVSVKGRGWRVVRGVLSGVFGEGEGEGMVEGNGEAEREIERLRRVFVDAGLKGESGRGAVWGVRDGGGDGDGDGDGSGDRGGDGDQVRAHCGRLEALLREGFEDEIRWGRVLDSVREKEDGLELKFKDQDKDGKEKTSSDKGLIIDTSGVHSRVRNSLFPNPSKEMDVLPYVVFRGTRRIDGETFKNLYRDRFQGGNTVEMKREDVLFQVWINDYLNEVPGPEDGDVDVDISYVYSRPARKGKDDPLHRPDRTPGEASSLNDTFFDEVAQLHFSETEHPFRDAFNVEKMRRDRILHWLMRSHLIPRADLDRFAKKGLVFLGDAVHAMPILGGEGAGFAVEDAVLLADCLVERGGVEGVEEFYERRYGEWEDGVRLSRERLRDLHLLEKAVL